jgi:hypothetical protein
MRRATISGAARACKAPCAPAKPQLQRLQPAVPARPPAARRRAPAKWTVRPAAAAPSSSRLSDRQQCGCCGPLVPPGAAGSGGAAGGPHAPLGLVIPIHLFHRNCVWSNLAVAHRRPRRGLSVCCRRCARDRRDRPAAAAVARSLPTLCRRRRHVGPSGRRVPSARRLAGGARSAARAGSRLRRRQARECRGSGHYRRWRRRWRRSGTRRRTAM